MGKNEWNVSEAKQQFAEVLRRSESEPQLIYRRNRLIAAVVAVDNEMDVPVMTRRPTIGERFEEARELFRRENYHLPEIRRRSRSTSARPSRGETIVRRLRGSSTVGMTTDEILSLTRK